MGGSERGNDCGVLSRPKFLVPGVEVDLCVDVTALRQGALMLEIMPLLLTILAAMVVFVWIAVIVAIALFRRHDARGAAPRPFEVIEPKSDSPEIPPTARPKSE